MFEFFSLATIVLHVTFKVFIIQSDMEELLLAADAKVDAEVGHIEKLSFGLLLAFSSKGKQRG